MEVKEVSWKEFLVNSVVAQEINGQAKQTEKKQLKRAASEEIVMILEAKERLGFHTEPARVLKLRQMRTK